MLFLRTRRSAFLEGQKTNLRPLHKDDVPIVYRWLGDLELLELAFGVEESNPRFEHLIPAYKQEIGNNRSSFFAIDNKNGELIGFCSHILFSAEGRARIGILIGNRNYWDKGYGRDAVFHFLKYLFIEKRLKVIELDTAPFNVRAQRCFVACGFKMIHKEWSEHNDKYWYELSREEFLSRFGI